MVLDRHATDRNRSAADWLPPGQAWPGRQVPRRSAHHPWIFSWAQARINLAAWYGLGTACEKFGDLDTLRQAYEEWPLFSTFIDNIEMSIAKTDERIAKMYLALGDREDLNKKVLEEMELTRKWVLDIVGDKWPLQHRHVLGQAIRVRSPYVDALSVTQVLALKSLRKKVDKEELSQSQQAGFIYLILCTVSGVAAGLQNTADLHTSAYGEAPLDVSGVSPFLCASFIILQ